MMKTFLNVISKLILIINYLFSCSYPPDLNIDFDDDTSIPNVQVNSLGPCGNFLPGDTILLSFTVRSINTALYGCGIREVKYFCEYPKTEITFKDIPDPCYFHWERAYIVPKNPVFGSYSCGVISVNNNSDIFGTHTSSCRIVPCKYPPIRIYTDLPSDIGMDDIHLNGHIEFEDSIFRSRITEYGFVISTGSPPYYDMDSVSFIGPIISDNFCSRIENLYESCIGFYHVYCRTNLEAWWSLNIIQGKGVTFITKNRYGGVYTDSITDITENSAILWGHIETLQDWNNYRYGFHVANCDTNIIDEWIYCDTDNQQIIKTGTLKIFNLKYEEKRNKKFYNFKAFAEYGFGPSSVKMYGRTINFELL